MNEAANTFRVAAEGIVRDVFSISSPNWTVVVLEDGRTTGFEAPGFIENAHGRFPFNGIEYVLGKETIDGREQAKEWVALTIDDVAGRAKALFQKGDRVRIYPGLHAVD